jgi:hypothetical protein
MAAKIRARAEALLEQAKASAGVEERDQLLAMAKMLNDGAEQMELDAYRLSGQR